MSRVRCLTLAVGASGASWGGWHKASAVCSHLPHSPRAWGIKPPRRGRTSGWGGQSRVPSSHCSRRVARRGRGDAGTHRHLTPCPCRRCFSGPARWPGWRSSGTHRPAGTSPSSRQRAGASWHGSSSRRGRFVPAALPSPLRSTISPKMGSAAFLQPPGPAPPPPPASPRACPAVGGQGEPGGTGGEGAGHRRSGMKRRIGSYFYR